MNAFRSYRRLRQARRRCGAAMVEFVMVIPLLATVLALTFWFGWSMVNQQHVRMADRYAVWRVLSQTGMPSNQQINEGLLASKGTDIHTTSDSGPATVLQSYVDIASSQGDAAGTLANELVLARFPRGLRIELRAEFPSNVRLWQRFNGPIAGRHVRDGVQWRRSEVRCESALNEMFLSRLNEMLTTLPPQSQNFGAAFRDLYLGGW